MRRIPEELDLAVAPSELPAPRSCCCCGDTADVDLYEETPGGCLVCLCKDTLGCSARLYAQDGAAMGEAWGARPECDDSDIPL